MIDEEKLEQLLEDNYGELYKELQFMPVDEFVAKNKDKLKAVPGFLDLYSVTSNAPHGMTDVEIESYFDKDSDKANYRQSEAEYQKQLAEKTKEAEGFDPDRARRKKLIDEYQHSYFGMDTSNPINKGLNFIADAVISPGTKQAIIEDEPTWKIGLRGASDIAAVGADAIPGIGGYVIGPTIRGANRLTNDDLEGAGSDIALDYGGNVILGQGIRGLAGVQDLGPVQRLLSKIPFERWSEIFRGVWGPKGPKMPNKTGNAFDYINSLPPETREQIIDAATEELAKQTSSYDKKILNKELEEEIAKTVDADARQYVKDRAKANLNQDWSRANLGKALGGMTAEDAIRTFEKGSARAGNKYLRSGSEDPKQKKYDTALDYIIKENERMWKAGFRPHAGIELEAWKKWKGVN